MKISKIPQLILLVNGQVTKIIIHKIKLLFRREALAAFEGTNPLINITPEVIELINQESEE